MQKKGVENKESLSKLELKLKRKIRILNSLDDKNFLRKQKLLKDI